MGFGGISIWQLLIILAIIVLLFGTKKLRHIGADLGNAVRGFKKAVNDDKEVDDKKVDEINADDQDKTSDSSLHTESSSKTVKSKDTAKNGHG